MGGPEVSAIGGTSGDHGQRPIKRTGIDSRLLPVALELRCKLRDRPSVLQFTLFSLRQFQFIVVLNLIILRRWGLDRRAGKLSLMQRR